jgi:hypothetical protein
VVLDIKLDTVLSKMLVKRGYTILRDPEEGYWAIKKK